MLRRQGQHQRLGRHAQRGQIGRREARRVQHESGIDITALESVGLHIGGGLQQVEPHLRIQVRETRAPIAATRCNPRSRQKPAAGDRPLRRAAERAIAGSACARASRSSTSGSSAAPRGAQPHAAFGAVEQPHAEYRLKLRNTLRQWRLRHVQAARGAAEMQFLRDRGELAPQPQVDWTLIHMQLILVVIKKYIGTT